MAKDNRKQQHSKNLSVLLYIAHVLPQACKSEDILEGIFLMEDGTESWSQTRNFHANFSLNGWKDHIIQPARDAVLDYYKVRTHHLIYKVLALRPNQLYFIYYLNQRYAEPSNLEEYMRVNNLS